MMSRMFVFIDETGDHSFDRIDVSYPIFGLGALLISEENYILLNKTIDELKKEFFGDDGTFILHSSELKRPFDKRSDARNAPMLDSDTRKSFYAAFDKRVLEAIDFKLIFCVIRKQLMKDTYKYPIDPYHFSFENILNRIIKYGGRLNTIYTEKRGPELDTELLAEYERLSKIGIHSYSAEQVLSKTNLKLVAKKENMNGLQVVDLVLAAYVRNRLGKKIKMKNNDLNPDLVASKTVEATTFPGIEKEW